MELQTNPHNPRTISKDAYEKLKRSIERNPDGLTANKIAYKDGIIISGNQRYRAILELGLTIKPEWLKDLSGWTQEQIDEWVIQSNISAGEWDWDILANEWEQTDLEEWGVDTSQEWDNKKDLPEDIDEIPEVKTPISKLGDLWLLGNHRVLCGDSTDKTTVELLMDGKKADMVFTDPPYSVNYTKKNKEVFGSKDYTEIKNDAMSVEETAKTIWKPAFDLLAEYAKDDCSLYCTMPQGGDQMMMMMMMMMDSWQVKHELIWVKEAPVFSMNRLDYDYKHEPFVYGWKKKHNWYGKGEFTKSVWEIKRDGNKSHPTMKPVALITNAALNSTKTGDLVTDAFLGSGSTLIACEQTDRTCYGLELDPHYVDVICKRWQTLTGEQPILQKTQKPRDFIGAQ
jgi:DNA modification methylase